MTGLVVSAKNMVQALVRNDRSAWDQFIKLQVEAEKTQRGASPNSIKKPRRNFEQIMEDFAEELFENAYQLLCDSTDETDFSNRQVYGKAFELIYKNHFEYIDLDFADTMLLMMLESIFLYLKDVDPGCYLVPTTTTGDA
jgi:hypothetical protein